MPRPDVTVLAFGRYPERFQRVTLSTGHVRPISSETRIVLWVRDRTLQFHEGPDAPVTNPSAPRRT
jgi:hypothetical protein